MHPTKTMPTYDPSLPVRADDGGADHLRRARTCLRDAKPREAHTHLVSAVEMGNADAMGELSFGTLVCNCTALTERQLNTIRFALPLFNSRHQRLLHFEFIRFQFLIIIRPCDWHPSIVQLISGFPSDVSIAFQHASAGHALGSAVATAALAWCFMNGWVRRAGPLLFSLF